MKLYTIYLKDYKYPEKALFIEESFSYMATLLTPFWLIYNKLWNVTFYYMIFFLLNIFLLKVEVLTGKLLLIELFIASLAFGLFGHDLIRLYLKNKGYSLVDICYGQNLYEVKKNFYENYVEDKGD